MRRKALELPLRHLARFWCENSMTLGMCEDRKSVVDADLRVHLTVNYLEGIAALAEEDSRLRACPRAGPHQ